MGSYNLPPELAEFFTDVKNRLSALERSAPLVQTVSGAPTDSPADGALRIDKTNGRLYVRYNAAWHYATLT